MLRRIAGWARRRRMTVRLTRIDRNPFATQVARELRGTNNDIEWETCEAFDYDLSMRVDLVVSSLFTHHLPDAETVRFLPWMEQVAARRFVNDLWRGRTPYYAFKLLARGMRWHRFVQHDGQVSIRRSSSREDWARYSDQAGLNASTVDIFSTWPGRLCVSRVKR